MSHLVQQFLFEALVLIVTGKQKQEYLKEFQEQIEAARSLIQENQLNISNTDKERRSALNTGSDVRQNLREERREERSERRETTRRKTKRALKGDYFDLNRKESRQFAKLASQGNRQERQESRADRRRQRGEQLGENEFISDARKIVSESFPFEDSLIQLFMTEEEFEQFGLRGFDFMGGLRDAASGIRGEEKERKLRDFKIVTGKQFFVHLI